MGIQHKTTLWLDDEDGAAEVRREDHMILISPVPGEAEELEVFILPDLFPKIRAAMDAADQAWKPVPVE